MKQIPEKLCDTSFRFYRARVNDKTPIDPAWNKTNNFMFFEDEIQQHKGNIGIVTGFGNLIVIDFDSNDFHNSCADKMIPTFTVRTAKKKLPHYYYKLEGEMFQKISVRDDKEVTLADIQADKVGIIIPPSTIDRKHYTIERNSDIATITREDLLTMFPNIQLSFEKKKEFKGKAVPDPIKMEKTRQLLREYGIKETIHSLFKCPNHPMLNHGNLHILPTGGLYCFHEQKFWRSVDQFIKEVRIKNGKL